jgi:predicted transcriptional regulator
MGSRKYRARIEILRDVLAAAQHEDKKTRIIGLANLNLASFDKYAAYCIEHGLLVSKNGEYKLTSRAEKTLGVIHVVLTKSSELAEALQEFGRVSGDDRAGLAHPSTLLQLYRDRGDHLRRPTWTKAPPEEVLLRTLQTQRRR